MKLNRIFRPIVNFAALVAQHKSSTHDTYRISLMRSTPDTKRLECNVDDVKCFFSSTQTLKVDFVFFFLIHSRYLLNQHIQISRLRRIINGCGLCVSSSFPWNFAADYVASSRDLLPLRFQFSKRARIQVHRKFEEQFWGTKMALSNGTPLSSGTAPAEYSVAALTETKRLMEDFLADPKKLERTRELLKASDLSPEQRKVLTLFERTFKCYIMEDAEARRLREEATKIEGTLESARNKSVAAPKRARIKCSIQST